MAEPDATQSEWVVRRDGSAHDILSTDGTWATMDTAARFTSQTEAFDAACPEGTTGTPIQLHPDVER